MKTATVNDFIIYPISECAVTVEFGNSIDEGLMQEIGGFDHMIHQKPFGGMLTTVPAYTTLTIFFNPLELINNDDLPGKSCFDKVSGYLKSLNDRYNAGPVSENEIINIPVYYGGSAGADIEYVAAYHNLTIHEVITLHSQPVYKVYTIGFIPGFAYMGGLNESLHTPRKPTPRKAVPAGAVGIAGQQTGIYPLETPGGWQIIGQTPLSLFDANRQPPALLKAGDRVKFVPISLSDFENKKNNIE